MGRVDTPKSRKKAKGGSHIKLVPRTCLSLKWAYLISEELALWEHQSKVMTQGQK
jgi:hypothetical protein